MNSLLVLSLQITALGMGIVFTAIILLSVMMSLLTCFTEQREDISEPGTGASDSPESAPDLDREFKAQAAAVAVALALAEQKISQPIHEPPTTLVSAWQLGMRTRQLYQKGMSLRRGARKAG